MMLVNQENQFLIYVLVTNENTTSDLLSTQIFKRFRH